MNINIMKRILKDADTINVWEVVKGKKKLKATYVNLADVVENLKKLKIDLSLN